MKITHIHRFPRALLFCGNAFLFAAFIFIFV